MSLDKIFSCQARKKIVHFFHNNPMSIDTIRGIVTWTGLNKKQAAKALQELVKAGILIVHSTSSTIGYAYTNNKRLVNKIKRHFQKNENS